jgi:ammonia channel protein AmtB
LKIIFNGIVWLREKGNLMSKELNAAFAKDAKNVGTFVLGAAALIATGIGIAHLEHWLMPDKLFGIFPVHGVRGDWGRQATNLWLTVIGILSFGAGAYVCGRCKGTREISYDKYREPTAEEKNIENHAESMSMIGFFAALVFFVTFLALLVLGM